MHSYERLLVYSALPWLQELANKTALVKFTLLLAHVLIQP